MQGNKPIEKPEGEDGAIYSDADIDKVMAALGDGINRSRNYVQNELEFCAGLYIDIHHNDDSYIPGETPASDEEQLWKSIYKSSGKLVSKLKDLPIDCLPEDLDVLLELQTRFIKRTMQLSKEASDRKKIQGGNVPDRKKYSFMVMLNHMIIKPCIGSKQTFKVSTDRKNNKKSGPLFNFLSAVFTPLKTGDSVESLIKSFHRATKT